MNNILSVNNLGKFYTEFQLKDINFNLPYGFIMGLIGQNLRKILELYLILTTLLIVGKLKM